jgi:uncharacterized protein with NRDE domain
MCLILFAHQCHREYPLIVAANRDERHQRPSQAARFWPDMPSLLGGKDLSAGGTWMGTERSGRFAAVTNFRGPTQDASEFSRGALCLDFLTSTASSSDFLNALVTRAESYAGFNLLLWDGVQLMHLCNQEMRPRVLGPGIYGVSNGLLNEDWPKVSSGRRALAHALRNDFNVASCLNLLADRSQPHDQALPATGVGLAKERLLAPRFISSEDYGTRVSSVFWHQRNDTVGLVERRFNSRAVAQGQVGFEFRTRCSSVASRTDA